MNFKFMYKVNDHISGGIGFPQHIGNSAHKPVACSEKYKVGGQWPLFC